MFDANRLVANHEHDKQHLQEVATQGWLNQVKEQYEGLADRLEKLGLENANQPQKNEACAFVV